MTVHLVFHGVFAFIVRPDGIDVIAPYVDPHEFLFGSWGKLGPLPKGTMPMTNLIGVPKGGVPNPDFDRKRIPTVTGLTQVNPANVFCVVQLPALPLRVDHFRPYTKQIGGITIPRFPFMGVHGDTLNPDVLTGPAVLTYETKDVNSPQLHFRNQPLVFERTLNAVTGSPGQQVLNLHFFSGGEKELPPRGDLDRPFEAAVHTREAWTRLTSVVAGLDIRISRVRPFVAGPGSPVPAGDVLPGLPGAQLASLDELAAAKLHATLGGPIFAGSDCDCEPIQICVDNR
jgi:hypothetical protein